MSRLRVSIPWLGLVGTLSMVSAAAQDGGESDDVVLDRTPEDCVITTRIRNTKIVNDETILFYLGGGKIYQNVLPEECPRLKANGRFAYQVRTTRLCRVDTITVLDRFGGAFRPGFTCRLGRFLPITELEADALLGAADDKKKDVGLDQFEVKPVPPPENEDDGSGDNTR